jgi:superfamily II RNA helicase
MCEYCDCGYDDYSYESEAEDIVTEYKNKMYELLNKDVKNYIERVKSDNKRLEETNKKLLNDYNEIRSEINTIERNQKEFERNFINKKLHQIFDEINQLKTIYCLKQTWTKKDKCEYCDDKRKELENTS